MADLRVTFDQKYEEFATDLLGALPELTTQIQAAQGLSKDERFGRFVEEVFPHAGPGRDGKQNPGLVLPGVTITDTLWAALSEGSKKAIQEYLTLLTFCALTSGAKHSMDLSGNPTREWMDDFMKSWKDKLDSVDFESMSKKLADLMGGMSPDKFPKIPERLLKGHLAKLAEELVREFKPEDFGLDAEELRSVDNDPGSAFQLLTEIYTKRPEVLQRAIQRVATRLQDMIKRGKIRPDQIAAEAEELMKEFTGNTAFVEMMESFRNTFGMEDPDLAREAGQEGTARRNIVKERLRQKLAAKQAAKKK